MSRRLLDPRTLVSRWPLQGNADDAIGRYPGTLVNAPTWGSFYKNNLQAIELDGNNQHVNVGDVTQLNAVSQFSISFWMAQDVLDIRDWIFDKQRDGNNVVRIWISGPGSMLFGIRNGTGSYGSFDYTTVMAARDWHHIVMVFDGSGATNADRLKAYVDGQQITLAYTLVIPAMTNDLSGFDATIGRNGQTLDGKVYDVRLYNIPLTNDEVLKIYHAPVPTY